jgi:acetyl/propionyl-CoA carboxylase alpha subunit
MKIQRLLIANRGEVAIRIARAAAELGVATLAVHAEDDASCLHVRRADAVQPLRGRGAAAYLDLEQLVRVAVDHGCDALHPGYGFLSESAAFARRCGEVGVRFAGPAPHALEVLGDKLRARELAVRCGVPVLAGGAATRDGARALLAEQRGPILLKAVAGGGGRGMRTVADASELDAAWERASSEASAAFGRGELYAERLLPRARHIEVQVLGDGEHVRALGDRECSLQRRHQKIVEIAPAPALEPGVRAALTNAALELARALDYASLGTFEFLLAEDGRSFFFIEANPRLQVEHTVTEEVTGIDLVRAQLEVAAGRSLRELGLLEPELATPRGFAVQARVCLESLEADGSLRPTGGVLAAFEAPGGPGVRVDSCAYGGWTPSPSFDPLLAKVIAWSPHADPAAALARADRALAELVVEGPATNRDLLRALLRRPEVASARIHTRFVEEHAAELAAEARALATPRAVEPPPGPRSRPERDPLAVLEHGKGRSSATSSASAALAPPPRRATPPGTHALAAPLQGTVVKLEVVAGATVRAGQPLLVLEAMKMEHVIAAQASGRVVEIAVQPGDTVLEGHPLAFVAASEVAGEHARDESPVDLDTVRPDLAEVLERHAIGLDAARPAAVERRRATGQRTARENIADLCDPGSFVEYGPLVIAAQRRRRELDDLIANTPADGLVAGVGRVNGALFGEAAARCMVISYDYSVLAGTQGQQNHRKKDRMFELAEQWQLPVVLFSEGGGGRPGDTDGIGVAGLDCMAFTYFARLSGRAPLVGINSGRCFAGNAALLGTCDVVIATRNSNIGMGGPAMVEGGGLGIFRPEDIGPIDVQVANGVVDLAVEDEAEAVRVARQYLGYFQGRLPEWTCADQRLLRSAIPENRLRVYDVRSVLETLADAGSVLELRRGFGPGMVTALARIEGRPLGVIANNPTHLAGAIDSPAADKAARFMQLCDAFDLPILFLCDTPGIMVGPEIEKTALVRHAARMFVTSASLTVPFFTIVLRKGYGLGAQAMAGGSFKAGFFTVAWPTGEFGGMGLEGAVKLGYRKELAALDDPAARRALFDEMVERMYRHGRAVNTASHFEIDDVIDPAESRRFILGALRSAPAPAARAHKKRPCIDTW